MPKRKKSAKAPEIPLDTYRARRGRGRPERMPAGEIYGRSENYRDFFWDKKIDRKKQQVVRDRPHEWAERILKSASETDLGDALEGAPPYVQGELRPFLSLILSVLREKTFPKSKEPQLNYLADSIAGLGHVSPRSSRDICSAERAKERAKSPHRIIRKEFYIECTCGYKGPALDNACRKCKAEIPMSAADLGFLS